MDKYKLKYNLFISKLAERDMTLEDLETVDEQSKQIEIKFINIFDILNEGDKKWKAKF